jgi:hypothetical protein
MAELTYREAVARGIAQEMTRDPDVVFIGEDIGKAGGVFKATVGLYEQFGPLRVRDTSPTNLPRAVTCPTARSNVRWWCAPAMAVARVLARSIRRVSRTGA